MGTSRYLELVERLEQAGMGKVLGVYEDGSKLVENGPAIAKEAAEAIKGLLSLAKLMMDGMEDALISYDHEDCNDKIRSVIQKAREALGADETVIEHPVAGRAE